MKRQQECSCGGKEQYSLTQMFQKKAPGGQGSGCACSARKITSDQGVGGKD